MVGAEPAVGLWQIEQNESGRPAWFPGYGAGPKEAWHEVQLNPPGMGCDIDEAAGNGEEENGSGVLLMGWQAAQVASVAQGWSAAMGLRPVGEWQAKHSSRLLI